MHASLRWRQLSLLKYSPKVEEEVVNAVWVPVFIFPRALLGAPSPPPDHLLPRSSAVDTSSIDRRYPTNSSPHPTADHNPLPPPHPQTTPPPPFSVLKKPAKTECNYLYTSSYMRISAWKTIVTWLVFCSNLNLFHKR